MQTLKMELTNADDIKLIIKMLNKHGYNRSSKDFESLSVTVKAKEKPLKTV